MKFIIEVYDLICDWFINHPISSGALMAFLLAVMRVFLRGERKFVSILIESLMCACISIGVTFLITSIWTIDSTISIFVGSMCGYLGVDNIKLIANRYLQKKLNEITDKDNNNEYK